jgi:hypothetical protein
MNLLIFPPAELLISPLWSLHMARYIFQMKTWDERTWIQAISPTSFFKKPQIMTFTSLVVLQQILVQQCDQPRQVLKARNSSHMSCLFHAIPTAYNY